MSKGRKLAEVGLLVVLVVGSLWLGKAMGTVLFPGERGPLIPPPAAAPAAIMGLGADGEASPIDIAGRDRPLIAFVLSVDCPFCRQTLPYWRNIAEQVEAGGEQAPEIVILSLSPAAETAAYLAEHRLPSNFIVINNDELGPLDVPGVPATFAFSTDAEPMQRWVGVLNDTQVNVLLSWARAATEKRVRP